MCSKNHTKLYTEEKDKPIEDSIITETIDDKTTFEMQVVTGDQVEASASKAEVVSGDQVEYEKTSASNSTGKTWYIKKETFFCRMCYTVYSRKQQYEELKKRQ